jgi:hypothetical protein
MESNAPTPEMFEAVVTAFADTLVRSYRERWNRGGIKPSVSSVPTRGSSLRLTDRSTLRIQPRTGAIDARTSSCRRTAIWCCVISPRTWPRNWTQFSMEFCVR